MDEEEIVSFCEAKINGTIGCCCLDGSPTHEEIITSLCKLYLDAIYVRTLDRAEKMRRS